MTLQDILDLYDGNVAQAAAVLNAKPDTVRRMRNFGLAGLSPIVFVAGMPTLCTPNVRETNARGGDVFECRVFGGAAHMSLIGAARQLGVTPSALKLAAHKLGVEYEKFNRIPDEDSGLVQRLRQGGMSVHHIAAKWEVEPVRVLEALEKPPIGEPQHE